ncbi:hypothetical protein TNCT1_60940 [Streptomyces sp. 1-11]|nr:hypothetical protein TNCT1_60940 [Streptomyces sp. 1-11]
MHHIPGAAGRNAADPERARRHKPPCPSSDEFPDGRKSAVRRQHHTRAGSKEAR